jgi:hypothetical protein
MITECIALLNFGEEDVVDDIEADEEVEVIVAN